jgi:cold shock CspA family protein
VAQGKVVEFDERAGYGTVREVGGSEHFFHCTAIADGSRTIEVGADVNFDVVPGGRGRWEATRVAPVTTPG